MNGKKARNVIAKYATAPTTHSANELLRNSSFFIDNKWPSEYIVTREAADIKIIITIFILSIIQGIIY